MKYLLLTFSIPGRVTRNETRYNFMKVVNKYFVPWKRGIYLTSVRGENYEREVEQALMDAYHERPIEWELTPIPAECLKQTKRFEKE